MSVKKSLWRINNPQAFFISEAKNHGENISSDSLGGDIMINSTDCLESTPRLTLTNLP